jgi:hypothetical protein
MSVHPDVARWLDMQLCFIIFVTLSLASSFNSKFECVCERQVISIDLRPENIELSDFSGILSVALVVYRYGLVAVKSMLLWLDCAQVVVSGSCLSRLLTILIGLEERSVEPFIYRCGISGES